MTEQEFGRNFVNFLISEKGYPKRSLLLEAPLADNKNSSRRYFADLLILDTDFNNYLALVEFKGSRFNRQINDIINQVKTYLAVIDQANLPAYLVLPKNGVETDFTIYILDNNVWREIEKVDFPHYETLSSKNQADEKKDFKDLNEIKIKEVKKKKELLRATAFSTLASLIAGIIATIFISKNIFFKDNNSSNPVIVTCCDSIQTIQQKVNYKIALLEKTLLDIKKQDSIIKLNGDKIEFSKLNSKIENIENIINQTPERLLKIQEVSFQLQTLKTSIESEKELSDTKLTNLKERIDQLTIWTSGLIITIIGSIIGFAVNAFRKS